MYQYSSIVSEISPKLLWPRLASTPDFYALLPWMEGTYLECYSAYSHYFSLSLFHFFLSSCSVPSVSFSPYSINLSLLILLPSLSRSLSLPLNPVPHSLLLLEIRLVLQINIGGDQLWKSIVKYNPTIITGALL